MKNLLFILLLAITSHAFSQSKNFIDQPYLETTAKVDTMVSPDKIYLSILISEKDTKGKISVEELESQMAKKLSSAGINIEKQLYLSDLSSNFKKYFLQQKDILKSKMYKLIVYNAQTAGQVIVDLENLGISNVDLEKTEYSKIEDLKLELKSKGIVKAKKQAEAMTKPLNQKTGPAIYITDNYTYFSDNVSAIQLRKSATLYEVQVVDSYKSYKPAIEFEKIKIEIEINAKFKIE